MGMKNTKLIKSNSVYLKLTFKLLILLTFISTCSENPTESSNITEQEFSIQYAVSPGEEILSNI